MQVRAGKKLGVRPAGADEPAIRRGSQYARLRAALARCFPGALECRRGRLSRIVGARNALRAGLKFAGTLQRDLVEAGFVHRLGLRAASIRPPSRHNPKASTVAVLAVGP